MILSSFPKSGWVADFTPHFLRWSRVVASGRSTNHMGSFPNINVTLQNYNFFWKHSEEVAISYDGVTGFVTESSTERTVTMATERIPMVTNPGGHLPPLGTFDSSVILEEVATDNPSYDSKSSVPEGAPSVVEPEESVTHLVTAGMPTVDVARPSLYKNIYRSLLAANQELMILVGELRRERNTMKRRCNEVNPMLEGRDRDNVLYHAKIDRLVGLGRALRG
ncbi:hypothetical protein Tco_1240726 [Tanacetum coccineum]